MRRWRCNTVRLQNVLECFIDSIHRHIAMVSAASSRDCALPCKQIRYRSPLSVASRAAPSSVPPFFASGDAATLYLYAGMRKTHLMSKRQASKNERED